jgi:hypothetical protein
MKYRQTKSDKPIPVVLDRELAERIRALSQRIQESKSVVMRMAMRIGLEALEKAFEPAAPKLSSSAYTSRPDEGVLVEERPNKKKAG